MLPPARHLPLLVLALPLLLAPAVRGQEAPPPAAELARYEVLLGSWVGEGKAFMGPQAVAWTSESRVTRVLGGHSFKEEMVIDVLGPFPMKLAYLNWHAYDTAKRRWISYSFSNSGRYAQAEVRWLEDGSLVSMGSGHEGAEPMAERWTVRFEDGVQHFEGQRLDPAGGLKTTVTGSARRVKEVSLDLSKIPFVGMTPSAKPAPQMARLQAMAGLYDVKGSYRMAAGDPPMTFAGTERISSLFGGGVVTVQAKGEGYEGFAALVWDPTDRVYVRVSLSSWGHHHAFTGHAADDQHLVFHIDDEMMGRRGLVRTVLKTDANGHLSKGWADAFMGPGPAIHTYDGTYRLREQKEGSAREEED
jgi:hypothetical protein